MKKIEYKNKIKLSRWERETVININDEDRNASLYTCQKKMMDKMDRLVSEFPEIFVQINELVSGDEVLSKTYEFPKKYVDINKPIILSEERKEELRKQLERARKKKEEKKS